MNITVAGRSSLDRSLTIAIRKKPRSARQGTPMTGKKPGRSDFSAEIKRLKAAGKLTTLEQVLDAVAETRKKYAPKILKTREQGPDQNPTLKDGHGPTV